MSNPKLAIYAVLLETSAWSGSLMYGNGGDLVLLWYLGVHLGASILLALFAAPLFRTQNKKQRLALVVLSAGFCYAIPIGGFVGMLLGIVMLRSDRKRQVAEPFESLQLPEFDPHQQQLAVFRQTGLRSFLNNNAVPMASRLGAMVALQHISGRVASPLLREVLSDPSEDIRLLAYGMLDNQEKRINKSIDEELKHLAKHQAAQNNLYFAAAQRLSDYYWELVYQELAQGDLRNYAIQESLRYCELVLAHAQDNAALNLRRGRLLHELGRNDEARQAYLISLALGLPAVRVLPYLAELNFGSHHFEEIAFIVEELASWSSLPRLRPLIDYWRPA